jgi:hypothetical protein
MMTRKTILQLSALALIAGAGVSTDFLARIYPPSSFGAAFAADEPMKIDFTQTSEDGDGHRMIDEGACPRDKDGNRACQTPLTLGEASYRSLRAIDPPGPGHPSPSADDLAHRDDLARAVRRATDYPLLDKDRELIKAQIARVYPSGALVGPAVKMLKGEK